MIGRVALLIRTCLLFAVPLVVLTGCTTSAPTIQPDPINATQSVAAGDARGGRAKVTASDYEAAVGRFGVCLAESGIELINDGWDPIDNERIILRYGAPGMTYDELSQATERCRSTHLEPVATKYSEDNQSHMAPELMAAVQECLRNGNIQLTGRELNPQDLLDAVPQNRQEELRFCVRESVRRLFPSLFSTSFP